MINSQDTDCVTRSAPGRRVSLTHAPRDGWAATLKYFRRNYSKRPMGRTKVRWSELTPPARIRNTIFFQTVTPPARKINSIMLEQFNKGAFNGPGTFVAAHDFSSFCALAVSREGRPGSPLRPQSRRTERGALGPHDNLFANGASSRCSMCQEAAAREERARNADTLGFKALRSMYWPARKTFTFVWTPEIERA